MSDTETLKDLMAEAYLCLQQIELWSKRVQALNAQIAKAQGEIARLSLSPHE